MKIELKHIVLALCTVTASIGTQLQLARGDEPQRDGPWLIESPDGVYTMTAEMALQPAAEAKPALQHRLLPDRFEMVDGNSAIYYLKAMGFLEQFSAAKKIREFQEKGNKSAELQGLPNSDFPPDSWYGMAPQQLPLAEVKEYLSYTSFQPPLLAEAALRTDFELERNIREVESPIAYLLPEIQSMRELARVQSLRCRVAIAEHRVDDAVKILRQQFAMARHLGLDEFLVSNLVGAAVLGIAIQDTLYVMQEPTAPNLYWAFATLPSPMIDMNLALSMERQFVFMQLNALREVDDKVRPAGYWQDFIDRILPQVRTLGLYDSRSLGSDPQVERVAFITMIAAAYPGAKRYLMDDCQKDRAQVEAYPSAQVVFLAMKRFQERTADDYFKWMNVPYDQAVQHPEFKQLDKVRAKKAQQLGWVGKPTDEMMAGIQNIRSAQTRVQQQICLLQTVEAIRMYGATNASKFPATLADLPYPAPNDPVSGKPFRYAVNGDQAMLDGQKLTHIHFRFKLRFDK